MTPLWPSSIIFVRPALCAYCPDALREARAAGGPGGMQDGMLDEEANAHGFRPAVDDDRRR